jgi:hypothetical protein
MNSISCLGCLKRFEQVEKDFLITSIIPNIDTNANEKTDSIIGIYKGCQKYMVH